MMDTMAPSNLLEIREHRQLASERSDRVVFPSPEDLLFPVPLRNVACCALLRLPDGTLRFLRVTAVAWTAERLDGAERMLARLDGDDPASPELARRIAYELGIPSLTLANPHLAGAAATEAAANDVDLRVALGTALYETMVGATRALAVARADLCTTGGRNG